MTITKPYTLADGVGNTPTAAKFNDDYDWLTALAFGNPIANGGFELWTGGTSFSDPANAATTVDGWAYRKTGTSLATADVAREATTVDTETYSVEVDITGAGHDDSIIAFDQAISAYAKFKGLNVVCGFRVKLSTASKVRVKINDGVTAAQYSSYHTGDGTWQSLQAVLAVSASASQLTLSIEIDSDFTGAVYIDGAYLYPVPATISDNARSYLKYFPQIVPRLPIEGGTLSGDLDMGGNDITNCESIAMTGPITGLDAPDANGEAARYEEVATGWVSAGETWTYASASTFTISGDLTGKYQKGDKLKLTNTTVKYFSIIGVSHGGGTTTVTVTGGTDYTLANAAISANYFSKAVNPLGFPTYFNYTPTYQGSGSMTYTSVTTTFAKFRIDGARCFVIHRSIGTTGGTASNELQCTVPVTADNTSGFYANGAYADDTVSGGTSGHVHVGTVFRCFKYDSSNYGLGGNRGMAFNIEYGF